jgi:diadenosine tetraphosphate (Ap4A) HIT family hydrolase
MDNFRSGRVPFDVVGYQRRSREGPCFVCAILAGHSDYAHHDVYEDAETIAFLSRYPTLLGHCLVAPKRHVECWVSDLDEEQFLAFQRTVHRIARAIAASVPTERMYSLSLGSRHGNAHLQVIPAMVWTWVTLACDAAARPMVRPVAATARTAAIQRRTCGVMTNSFHSTAPPRVGDCR